MHHNPVDLYMYFIAVKRHLTTEEYDIVKYEGKVKNATKQAFERNNAKTIFDKLARIKDAKNIILANLLCYPEMWAGMLLSEASRDRYLAWKKRKESLSYIVRTELSEIEDFKEAIAVRGGQHPKLLELYHSGKIGVDTMVILDTLYKFMPDWEAKISDPIIWPIQKNTITKAKPFISFDIEKMQKLCESRLAFA